MSEILYTIAATFPNAELAEAWLRWLRAGHMADVLACGASSGEIVILDSPAHSYEVRYRFPSREVFSMYERDHATRLRAEGLKLFPVEKGISYRRSVGTVCFLK